MQVRSAQDLFIHELSDIYDDERRISQILPQPQEILTMCAQLFEQNLRQEEMMAQRVEKLGRQLVKEMIQQERQQA